MSANNETAIQKRKNMSDVLIQIVSGQVLTWVAVPSTSGPVPRIVVIHDVGGMSQAHRNQANWLAEAGFLAVAPDLYYMGGMFHCWRIIARGLTARTGPTYEDIEA